MAARSLVLNSSLCFLIDKYGKLTSKSLKSMMLDFYDIAELCGAKMQLLSDVKKMSLTVEIPHVPERREGDNKAVRVVDDVLTLLAFLDENKKLDLLPRYVTESIDSVPSSRLYEGDLSVLMRVVEKMEREIKELNLALASLRREVVQQRQVETAHLSSHPDVNIGLGARPKVFPSSQTGVIAGECIMTSRDSPRRSADLLLPEAVPVARDWAAAAASTPIPVHNRYSALASTDDDERDSEPFVEWSSRRSAKRRRVHSQQQQQRQQQRQQASGQHPATQRRDRGRGQTVMTGKSNSGAHQFTAAREIVRKAVFCVDNVNLSLDVDGLRQFVTGQLKVKVFSCFQLIHDAEEMTRR